MGVSPFPRWGLSSIVGWGAHTPSHGGDEWFWIDQRCTPVRVPPSRCERDQQPVLYRGLSKPIPWKTQ